MTIKLKYQKGDKVEFTFLSDGVTPSQSWMNNNKKGWGIVIKFDVGPHCSYGRYGVKIINPSNWNHGKSLGLLKGKDAKKGHEFIGGAIRPMSPSTTQPVSMRPMKQEFSTSSDFSFEAIDVTAPKVEKKDGDKLFDFFKGEEKVEKICPECNEPMKRLLNSFYCPNNCDKT